MNNDRTANLLYLLDAIQRRYGPHLDRPALVRWLSAQLDDCEDLDAVLERYHQELRQK